MSESETIPRLLVVGDEPDSMRIKAMVEDAGLSVVGLADGGAETQSAFERLSPSVVVVCAGLQHGDARAVIAELRERSQTRPVKVILIGEDSGPVRNALDASEFDVDRFVGRPLSAKALVFAVRSCLALTEVATTDTASGGTTAVTNVIGRLDRVVDAAITEFVESAIDSLDEIVGGDDPWPSLANEDDPDDNASESSPADEMEVVNEVEDGNWAHGRAREPTQVLSGGIPSPDDLGFGPPPLATQAALIHAEEARDLAHPVPTDADEVSPAHELRKRMSNMADRLFAPPMATGAGTRESPAVHARAQPTESGRLGRDDRDAPRLIGDMFRRGFTGTIKLCNRPAEKSIFFEKGRPTFAKSNLPHDRMGDLLFREGKISRQQHAHSRELVVESGRRMGEILVELGFLKRRELLPAVRRHVEDVIYSVFSWESGEYTVAPGELGPDEKIRLSRHPAALIVEGVRRKYSLDRLAALIGSSATVVSVLDPELLKAVLHTTDLSEAEQQAIHSFDGVRPIYEVAEVAQVDVLTAYQLAYGLIAVGAATSAGAETRHTETPRTRALVGETDIAIDRQRVLAKYALVVEADYFRLLGVRHTASSFEVRRAYEAARRDYSQESFPAKIREELAREIDQINELLDEAYAVLRDDDMRGAYAANLL